MALAGAERIFGLLDEVPETDEGYVTLVNASKDSAGKITEADHRTGKWAWRHPHGDGVFLPQRPHHHGGADLRRTGGERLVVEKVGVGHSGVPRPAHGVFPELPRRTHAPGRIHGTF